MDVERAESTVCTDAVKELSKAIQVKVQAGNKKHPKQQTLEDMMYDLRLRVTRSDDLLKQLVEYAKDEENTQWKLQYKTHGAPKSNGISEVIADMEKSVEQVVSKIKFHRENEQNKKKHIHRLRTLLTTFSVSEKPKPLNLSDKESQNEKASLKNQQAKAGGEITWEKEDIRENVIESLENAIRKEKDQNVDNAIKTVREMNHTIEAREKEVASLNKDVKYLKQENQELHVRLAYYAGAQLGDNNPNITELSDPNRPTKLAKEFSNLYDDEWINAFDEMDNMEDTDAIDRLYRVFKEAYTYCMKQSTGHLTSIRSAVIYPGKLEQESEQTFHPVILNSISDFRKATATVTMKYIVQAFETRHGYNDKPGHKDKNATPEESKPQNSGKVIQIKMTGRGRNNSGKKADGTLKEDGRSQKQNLKASVQSDESSAKTEAMQIYTQRCVELCWLAVVQEPPLYIDFATTAGDTLDTKCYRLYTKQGKNIDYVVWPAVFLEKGKCLLSKGLAQGK